MKIVHARRSGISLSPEVSRSRRTFESTALHVNGERVSVRVSFPLFVNRADDNDHRAVETGYDNHSSIEEETRRSRREKISRRTHAEDSSIATHRSLYLRYRISRFYIHPRFNPRGFSPRNKLIPNSTKTGRCSSSSPVNREKKEIRNERRFLTPPPGGGEGKGKRRGELLFRPRSRYESPGSRDRRPTKYSPRRGERVLAGAVKDFY